MLNLELDEATGTSFADTSGFGNNATAPMGGIAAGSLGHAGKAVNFSGGVLQVAGPTKIPDSPQVWVEAWIQPQAPLTVNRTILAKAGSYMLRQTATGDVSFRVFTVNTPAGCTATSSGAGLTAGTWYHVAGWYDGVHVSVTLNGQIRATVSCPGGPIAPTPTGAFYVGGADATATEPYQGSIDEVRVRMGAAQRYSGRYVSAWTSVTGNNTVYTFNHGLGTMPARCDAWWSPNASGTPKRRLEEFNQNCHANGLNGGWQGVDLIVDATNARFFAYAGGNVFCLYDNTGWWGSNTAYVQVTCDL